MERPPLWLVGVASAVFWTVAMLGMDVLRGEEMGPPKVAVTSVFGLLFGAFVVGFGRFVHARNRATPAAWPTTLNLKNAVVTGRLPEGASADQWIPELAKIIRSEKRMYSGAVRSSWSLRSHGGLPHLR
ncbi:hypothetical protein ACIP9X_18450 [Arthrobacter sp. NPDC093125]|uniref:hypothetical protein n=1 Tax=Arthrobacter sp. NPDC093125 TaxID=3363944 RepID=UPI0037F44D94